MDYIKEVERLTDAVTDDSDFTPEYLQTDNVTDNENIQEEIL